MAECAEPLVDYVDALREPGRVTAAIYAGVSSAEGEENGFMAHIRRTTRSDGPALDGVSAGDGHRQQYRGSYRTAGLTMSIREMFLT
mgnify:CR=1 FL=1